ncbi:conserved exported hypothetical protein [uncultured Paludibacter sp.]|uniref:Periplasmic ATP/GTP-binding protein n=1 Tax=uncultured Paludibacter sp. TaxID=497635 RepID=A0A653A6D5_9BACT|nr:conserved exported hypothetical protein [uncultured Paludibacter sp.]
MNNLMAFHCYFINETSFNMKSIILLFFGAISMLTSCNQKNTKANESVNADSIRQKTVFTDKIKFDESAYPYKGGILIANFGGEKLKAMNSEGKGYILYLKNDTLSEFIPVDGNLNAPKGMYIADNHLFIADMSRVVVYNLNDKTAHPQIITFPEEDTFINDLTGEKNTLYASVSNTGNIYKLDISDIYNIDKQKLIKFSNVVGANGLLIAGGKMYIASYPANTGKISEENVVYVINDLANPKPEKLIDKSGMYDGIQISEDANTLYVSNWEPIEIIGINLKNKTITQVLTDSDLKSIADFTYVNDKFYIPDLAGSKFVVFESTQK